MIVNDCEGRRRKEKKASFVVVGHFCCCTSHTLGKTITHKTTGCQDSDHASFSEFRRDKDVSLFDCIFFLLFSKVGNSLCSCVCVSLDMRVCFHGEQVTN